MTRWKDPMIPNVELTHAQKWKLASGEVPELTSQQRLELFRERYGTKPPEIKPEARRKYPPRRARRTGWVT